MFLLKVLAILGLAANSLVQGQTVWVNYDVRTAWDEIHSRRALFQAGCMELGQPGWIVKWEEEESELICDLGFRYG
ncbi:hypothetical protein FE257_003976 [Aspergillus nanangensis]|uniref:Uncharacterized protein n=1 Tax=Aspergillus nanangensis TaxID=2582783 RepID=A0AAD4GVA8_ASPNN|nr:hypothetical protein FE257_003976 [Aspergillus nanangensis]